MTKKMDQCDLPLSFQRGNGSFREVQWSRSKSDRVRSQSPDASRDRPVLWNGFRSTHKVEILSRLLVQRVILYWGHYS